MSKPDAATDLYSDAVKGGLTAVNAAGLAVCTLVGASLTAYSEITGAATPAALGVVALAGWLAAIVLTVYLAGRSASASESVSGTLRQGVQAARKKPRFAVLVLLLTAGAAMTVWSRAQSDRGGALASLRADTRQAATAATRAEASAASAAAAAQVVQQTIESHETPAAALARMGYRPTTEDLCRAVAAGDATAVALMTKLGTTSIAVNVGGGQWATCLESALFDESAGRKMADAIGALKLPAQDRDRVYVGQDIGNGDERNLKSRTLAAAMVPEARSTVILTSVRATPLMFAVWSDNALAVEALLRQGADRDEPGRIDISFATPQGTRMATLAVTPLHEARRLGLKRVEPLLAAAGARSARERRPFFQ